MVSIVHGVLVMVFSLRELIRMGFQPCESQTTPPTYHVLIFSSSYFTYDLLAMLYFGLIDLDMTIHHISVSAGQLSNAFYGTASHQWLYGMLAGEISNPQMHLRVLLKHMGYRYARSYEVAELLYFGTYIVGRMVGMQVLWVYVATCASQNIITKAVITVAMLQSYQNVFRMVPIIKRRLKEMDERNVKKFTFDWFTPIPQKYLEQCDFYKAS